MGISLIAGCLAGEGFIRLQERKQTSQLIKNQMNVIQFSLENQPLVKLTCGIFFTTILARRVLSKLGTSLGDRKSWIKVCAHSSISILETYIFSIPFLLGTGIYIARKEGIRFLLTKLQNLYDLLKQVEVFIANSVSDPSGLAGEVRDELKEGIIGVSKAAQSIAFNDDPEVIKTINQEIDDFEEHIKGLILKIPEFEAKLNACVERLKDVQKEFVLELDSVENRSSQIEKLLNERDVRIFLRKNYTHNFNRQ